MEINSMKNMIVLKNLPSNMIEEAFVVLKDNVKIHTKVSVNNNDNKNIKNNKSSNEYVIKEAELIINDYVNKIEKERYTKSKNTFKLESRCKALKYSNIFFVLLSIFSIISIILR